ncbi:MAG: IS1634 family transposase [Gammaproteobacteria bacterium]|nr:IS1634 family transposase [Gammaproteobacteria bacterium]
MYIEIVPNRNSRPAVLLREGWREGKKVCKRTIANLTDWPARKVETLRRVLKDEPLVSPQEAFTIERSVPRGHVEAALETVRHIGLDKLIGAKRTRERDLVLAMIIERLIFPCSKLATTRLWHTTTLAEELAVGDADEDELYAAMDWLLARQSRIEKKLAAAHLGPASHVLYDVSSSYYEGRSCSLAQFGHDRDGKRGRPIVVYGVLTDADGRPVAVEVYPGNTGDPSTVPDQVDKLKQRFGLERVVLVGDRGMLTQTQIEALREHPEIGWVSALRTEKIRQLAEKNYLQLSLFDRKNLAEISSPDFPGERLIACFNPLLAEERGRKREALLQATEQALEKLVKQVQRRTKTPLSAVEIGQKLGKVINRFKVGKHFETRIEDGYFSYARRAEAIEREAQLDGLYVIRTSEPEERLSAEDTVRSYKNLAQVERAFRTLKGLDLRIRPIHHRDEQRVRAHIFLCLLAYYVEWHMRQALAPLLFDDESLPIERWRRDPVAPAQPSESAKQKKAVRLTADGLPIHSFKTLMAELGTRCRHRCRMKSDPDSPAIYQDTELTPLQSRAMKLLRLLPVQGS